MATEGNRVTIDLPARYEKAKRAVGDLEKLVAHIANVADGPLGASQKIEVISKLAKGINDQPVD